MLFRRPIPLLVPASLAFSTGGARLSVDGDADQFTSRDSNVGHTHAGIAPPPVTPTLAHSPAEDRSEN